MQIETFRVFNDLVETSSFSEAAKRNNITQSAVSQQIRALEKRYGVVFFERAKKTFSMTPEGQVFHQAARELMEIYRRIEDRLQDLHNVVAGTLRLYTIYSIGLHDLPPIIKEYKQRFPEVSVEIEYKRSAQIYNEVLDGKADYGLVAYPMKKQGIVFETFDEDELVLICPAEHPFAKKKRLSLSDLGGENFVSFEPDIPTRKAVDRMLKDQGVKIKQSMEFDNIETVKRAVEVGIGISIVPKRSIQAEVDSDRLMSIKIDNGNLIRPLGLIRKRSTAISPAMREFLRLIKQK